MTKEYFSHDYGTRNKKKIAPMKKEKKMRGYGLFWVIVEMLHEDSTHWMELDELTFIAISAESGETVNYIKKFIETCITRYKVFIKEENRFTTERVLSNIGKRVEIKQAKVKAGKASAEKRKQNSTHVEHVLTDVQQPSTPAQQNPTKERKGKEKKEKNKYRDNIFLTQEENDKLVVLHGQEKTDACYDFLASYKIEKTYKTKSDYLTIGRWVVEAVEKKGFKATASNHYETDLQKARQGFKPVSQ